MDFYVKPKAEAQVQTLSIEEITKDLERQILNLSKHLELEQYESQEKQKTIDRQSNRITQLNYKQKDHSN